MINLKIFCSTDCKNIAAVSPQIAQIWPDFHFLALVKNRMENIRTRKTRNTRRNTEKTVFARHFPRDSAKSV